MLSEGFLELTQQEARTGDPKNTLPSTGIPSPHSWNLKEKIMSSRPSSRYADSKLLQLAT